MHRLPLLVMVASSSPACRAFHPGQLYRPTRAIASLEPSAVSPPPGGGDTVGKRYVSYKERRRRRDRGGSRQTKPPGIYNHLSRIP